MLDYEKMFCPDLKSGADIFDMRGIDRDHGCMIVVDAAHIEDVDMRGIDRDHGCMIVVRPDQYVGEVLPLSAHAELSDYFDRILRRRD